MMYSLTVMAGTEPTGYYTAAEGKTGQSLLLALHDIVDSHTNISYGGLLTAYKTTDKKDNGNVWDIYSDVPGGTPPYEFSFGNTCGTYQDEGDCYNREHTFPQSWFNKSSEMRCDLIQVLPTDGKVNGMRSNYPYGEVSNPSKTSENGSKVGPNTTAGYSGTVFEPLDEYKGDVARIYFYMAACYNDKIAGWEDNGTAGNVLAGNSYPVYDDWHIALLLKWHKQDPVSQKEIDRNEGCYDIQGNRNPFVDYPDFACAIWSDSDCSDIVITPGEPTTPADPTEDVIFTMNSTNFQVIVDYVNANLTNTNDYPDNAENYYGASAYFSNFDTRSDAYSSTFASADEAIAEAIGDVFLPAQYPDAILNVDYVVSYATYDGETGSGSMTFHCSSVDPLTFTAGVATVDPINPNPTDTVPGVDPVDPVDPITPTETIDMLNITFLDGLEGCTAIQVLGDSTWAYNFYEGEDFKLEYALINTYELTTDGDAWLVMPTVNMDANTNETLAFDVATYDGSEKIGAKDEGQFELYYTTSNFDGTTIDASQWTRIDGVDDVMLGAKWEWLTGTVDVSDITGSAVTFAFRHRCTASNGTSWEVDNIILQGETPSAIRKNIALDFVISPNPASSSFKLSVDADRVSVISVSGQELASYNSVSAGQSLDISSIENGIYFVKTVAGNKTGIAKMMKK